LHLIDGRCGVGIVAPGRVAMMAGAEGGEISMKPAYCLVAGLAALLLSGATVQAQDLVTVGEVGPWGVYVDPTLGNGCLINAEFEDGSDVRIGFDVESEGAYMIAANPAWGEIVEGETYPLSFDLDGSEYEGEGTGIYIDGLPGVDIAFESVDLLVDIAARQTLTLRSQGEAVMAIDLTDSAEALVMAIECQEKQG